MVPRTPCSLALVTFILIGSHVLSGFRGPASMQVVGVRVRNAGFLFAPP